MTNLTGLQILDMSNLELEEEDGHDTLQECWRCTRLKRLDLCANHLYHMDEII